MVSKLKDWKHYQRSRRTRNGMDFNLLMEDKGKRTTMQVDRKRTKENQKVDMDMIYSGFERGGCRCSSFKENSLTPFSFPFPLSLFPFPL